MNRKSQRLAENLDSVRQRIADAAARCGRRPDEIRLVAVTKYVDADVAARLATAGCCDLGESRPQELWHKAEAFSSLSPPGDLTDIRWHLVGHLQRNKVRRTLSLTHMVQSCDSPRLLETLDEESQRLDRRLPVLLEVNISGEEAKHGFSPSALKALLADWPGYPHLAVRGLMAMAALEGGAQRARQDFASLRELREQLRSRQPEGVSLEELSMGMSGDFEIAIEEGATIVRIGSLLFEGLEP